MIERPKWFSRLGLALLILVSGCTSTRLVTPPKRIVAGAALGALVGGAIGCTTAAFIDDDNRNSRSDNLGAYEIGCSTGVGVGAILGIWAAVETYHPAPPPPKPAPPPPPPPLPPPAPPPPPKAREKLVLRGVHFNFDKSDIRPEDEPVLDEAVQVLKSEPQVRVYVDGYCDIVGGDDYNLELSAERAASVVTYLENNGIASSRLVPRGFGKTHFVASNDTDEGRAQNRRVEMVPME